MKTTESHLYTAHKTATRFAVYQVGGPIYGMGSTPSAAWRDSLGWTDGESRDDPNFGKIFESRSGSPLCCLPDFRTDPESEDYDIDGVGSYRARIVDSH